MDIGNVPIRLERDDGTGYDFGYISDYELTRYAIDHEFLLRYLDVRYAFAAKFCMLSINHRMHCLDPFQSFEHAILHSFEAFVMDKG